MSQPTSNRPTSDVDRLMSIIGGVKPFSTPQGQACASIPLLPSGAEVWPIRSARFRDWLTATFFNRFDHPPSDFALRRSLATLEALAHNERRTRAPLDFRLASSSAAPNSSILLDLDNSSGQSVEISPSGWQLHQDHPHAFRHSRGNLPLPEPLRHAGPSGLQRIVNLSRRELILVHSWLTAALRPSGPYPILVLTGPTGSGKSSAASILRTLIDPSASPVGRIPSTARAFYEHAWHNWILAFDDVTHVSPSVATSLAHTASGSRYLLSERGNDREPLVFHLGRPIVLSCSSTSWLDAHPALRDRAVIVSLAPIDPAERLTEAALRDTTALLRPAILGTLCNAAATALRRSPSLKLPELPRMADFVLWAAAAAPAFNLSENDILAALDPPAENTLHAAVLEFVNRLGRWIGTASALLAHFRSILPAEILPATPKGLTQYIGKMGGIEIIRHRLPGGKVRLLELRARFGDAKKRPEPAQSAPAAA